MLGWFLSGVGFVLLFVAAQAGPPFGGVLLMASLLLLLAGLSCAAGYQIVARRTRPAEGFHGPSPLILFGVQLVVVNIVSAMLLVLAVPLTGSGPAFMLASIVLLAGYLVVVWIFALRTGALTLRGLGLPAGAGVARVVSDVAVGAAVMVVVAFFVALWAALLATLLNTPTPDVVPPPTTGVDAILVVVGACVLIPIGEELFFRGYALTAWLRDLGPRSALIRSTVFFAVVHVANIVVEPNAQAAFDGFKQSVLEVAVIAPVGLALGWLFMRRGLVASIGGHAAFNLIGVLTLILVHGR